MRFEPTDTVVVAGNGPSLARIAPGTVLASDRIIRTNSFFFEPRYFLGRRVDLAMMGGDPRVAPFVFETLWQCRGDYDLARWSSHDPSVVRAGHRRFGQRYVRMPALDTPLENRLPALSARFEADPTTGVRAALMAYGLGARQIIVTGVDLYTTPDARYTYAPGQNYRTLMGSDIGHRGMDLRLHTPDLDRAVLALLAQEDGLRLHRAQTDGPLADILDLAPVRDGIVPDQAVRQPPADWAAWAGLYPIRALKILRWGSLQYRRLRGSIS
ncbi:MAG: alpha-2,3-sialyltransferase [Pseudomonadota bacterium]